MISFHAATKSLLQERTHHWIQIHFRVDEKQRYIFRIATGNNKEKQLIHPCVSCESSNNYFLISGFKRTQCPVCVCFAIPTNKAQFQSFSSAIGLHLNHECFTHAQLYVTMSRTTHPSNIHIFVYRGRL